MGYRVDLTGMKFSRLTVSGHDGHKLWICQCSCGKQVKTTNAHLRTGHTQSCGCLQKEARHSQAIDIAGLRFGRLVALRKVENGKFGTQWECQCDCGNTATCRTSALSSGQKQSCGCLFEQNRSTMGQRTPTTHKLSKHPLYSIWHNMMDRCYNVSCKSFKHYGGRGIQVCPQWHSIAVFIKDMGCRPKGTTLERRNNNGNYDPENCEWATRTTQARNRSITRLATLNGITKPLPEWCEQYGIGYKVVHDRIGRYGWTLERALTTPLMHNKYSFK